MRKKMLSFLLMVCMLVGTFSFEVFSATWLGEGTAASPYLIYTAEDLFSIPDSSKSHYIVMNHLDLRNIDRMPISNFSGTFDGNNKIIKNLRITTTSGSSGLFNKVVNANLKNISLLNVDIQGSNNSVANSGGLVGHASFSSSIYNCHVVNVNIVAPTSFMGGLAGRVEGVVSNCSVKDFVGTSDYSVGGLIGVGSSTSVNINNSYVINTAISVSGKNKDFGAGVLIGSIGSNGRITNCYSASSTDSKTKQIFSRASSSITTANYFDKTLTNTSDLSAYARTTTEMSKQSTYVDWDFNTIWGIDEGKSYPYLLSNKDVYESYMTNIYLKAPKKLSVEQTDTEYILTWDAVQNATGYDVSINGDIVSTVYTSIKVNDLNAKAQNTVSVRAKNESLISPWSMKLTISSGEDSTEPEPTNPPGQVGKKPVNPKDPNVNLFDPEYRESEQASDVWYNSEECNASKALDGDMSTRWATSDNNFAPAVLTVNLKDVMAFNELFISEVSVRTARYTVEYLSLDTNEWVVFHTGTKIGGEATVNGFGEVITKGIRVTFEREPDEPGGVSIFEFQARYK